MMTKVTMYSLLGITWWIEHSQGPGSAKCHDQQQQGSEVMTRGQIRARRYCYQTHLRRYCYQ